MRKPFDSSFYRENAGVLLGVGQLELMVGLGVIFSILSLVILFVRGRGGSYFVSQFVGLAFIIVVVGVLFERVAAARVAHHILAAHGIQDRYYPELIGQKTQTPR